MQVDFEQQQVEATRAEKVLALALVVFLLIGGFWVMGRLAEIPERPDWEALRIEAGVEEAFDEVRRREQSVMRARQTEEEARRRFEADQLEYEFRREEYRTSLDAGFDDPDKLALIEVSRADFASSRDRHEAARLLLDERETELAAAREQVRRAEERFQEILEPRQNRYELLLFSLRFGYAVPLFALAVYLWQRLRARGNRYLIVATAFLAAAGIQVIFLAGEYAWAVFKDLGQLFVSVAGAAISIAGIVALRRYLFTPERIAQARQRRSQCPNCGYPGQGGNHYCVNCGEILQISCPGCGGLRPRGMAHCPHCGAGEPVIPSI